MTLIGQVTKYYKYRNVPVTCLICELIPDRGYNIVPEFWMVQSMASDTENKQFMNTIIISIKAINRGNQYIMQSMKSSFISEPYDG